MTQALIIDDTLTNIRVLQQLLRIEAVDSVTISNTKDFSEQLDAISNINLVFLDLEMPFMNGYEAFKVVKAHPNFSNTKVVAYSVHLSEINAVLAAGFDGFIGKPLNAEAFPDLLARILNGEKLGYLP